MSSSAPAQRGVALVITLILLAVITTLAIAFLALTYRETAAVDSMGRTTDSELACESAQQRARAEILAPFARNRFVTNGVETMGPDFMVSVGWHTNRLVDDPSTPFNELTNQFLNPTPPVFVNTNRAGAPAGPFEDRFHLDLNRNRQFEETGYVQDTFDNFQGVPGVTNWRVGDPQWIGILQDPRHPHGPDNRFIARYAYLVQPIGRSLDVNWIHNEAIPRASGSPGFHREQGVGSWELNAAGFLADLNTNRWLYDFVPNPDPNSQAGLGSALYDAREFLLPRFLGNRNNMDKARDLFPGGGFSLTGDQIDAYGNGFVSGPNPDSNDDPNLPWPGSDSKRHYFSQRDFFDTINLPTITPAWSGIIPPLPQPRGNSYDRYTYYRMLSQMGTDSAEEEDGKVNINYVNIRSWVDPNIRYRANDLISWTNTTSDFIRDMGRPGPELFFLTVATNLFLREPALAFIVTNRLRNTIFSIPIYTNGVSFATGPNPPMPGPLYAGRIHQVLQLAANIYDATTGPKRGEALPYFPSVFRPRFIKVGGDVFITDYELVDPAVNPGDTADGFRNSTANPWYDLESGEGGRISTSIPNRTDAVKDLVYGIPLIIGARKGFPAFNEIGVMTIAEATRKLEMVRTRTDGSIERTNQLFALNIVHRVQVEARNPYAISNPREIELLVGMRIQTLATNSFVRFPFTGNTNGYPKTYVPGEWPAEAGDLSSSTAASHVVTPTFQHTILNWATNTAPDPAAFTNRWGVTMTNRMLFFLIDRSVTGGRIVDAVTLKTPTNHLDVAGKLAEPLTTGNSDLVNIWSGERYSANSGLSRGIFTQLDVSLNPSKTSDQEWTDFATTTSKRSSITAFLAFLTNGVAETHQVPFTPSRRIVQVNYYQVNDPLVHYTLEDLRDDPYEAFCGTVLPNGGRTNLSANLGKWNPNSQTWNKGQIGEDASADLRDTVLRDPGLFSSDWWEFPTNRFPNVGWLGRVHRGTPWQTVYLKSRPAGSGWDAYSGPMRHAFSSALMRPQRDWELLDLFTTAPHPNATRGRLSVNQTNLAAWSAVLAGAVTSKTRDDPSDPGKTIPLAWTMEPVAISPEIDRIVEGINRQRILVSSNRYNGYLFAPFKNLSDLLSTPALTDASPFLNADPNLFDATNPRGTAAIMDADYERIPQQILSLVKLGEPRFVVYAWGQSLKPARRNPEDTGPSIVTSGADRGLCRNYQITGEMATRAVIRLEFDRIRDPFSPQYNQLDYSRPHAVVESFNILPVE